MLGVRAESDAIEAKKTVRSITCALEQQWWCWLIIGCIGCRAAIPPPPPEPPPPPPPPPVVEAPPPPKCEKVEEACVAGAETRARIGVGWQFAPPTTWIYAQGEEVTIATGKNAMIGVTVRHVVDVKKERADREEGLRHLAGQLGVTLPKKKILIAKKPDQKQKVGEVDVELYQFEGAKLDGRTGPLLFFVAKASKEQALIGVGFVPDNDSDNADQAIMGAIESLGPSAADAATDKKAP